MVQRLPLPDKENPDPRGDLDRALGVVDWLTPFVQRREVVPEDAPTWWHGDEDATTVFLRGMGVENVEQLSGRR